MWTEINLAIINLLPKSRKPWILFMLRKKTRILYLQCWQQSCGWEMSPLEWLIVKITLNQLRMKVSVFQGERAKLYDIMCPEMKQTEYPVFAKVHWIMPHMLGKESNRSSSFWWFHTCQLYFKYEIKFFAGGCSSYFLYSSISVALSLCGLWHHLLI